MRLVENLHNRSALCDRYTILGHCLENPKPLTLSSLRKAAKDAKKIFLAWSNQKSFTFENNPKE